MTEAVLADAQFGTANVLKPYENFEDDYQGLRGNIPIAIPGSLDMDAGKDGFAENLISAAPVPFGAKILTWIPSIEGRFNGIEQYEYRVLFRLRNLRDFRENRQAYHFPRQSLGENDQFVIPAAKKVIIYESPTDNRFNQGFLHQELTSFGAVTIGSRLDEAPVQPGAANPAVDRMDIEQGLGGGTNRDALFNPVSFDADGDEVIFLVTKANSQNDQSILWEFESGEDDFNFSTIYGKGSGKILPDTGIYLFSGSNP